MKACTNIIEPGPSTQPMQSIESGSLSAPPSNTGRSHPISSAFSISENFHRGKHLRKSKLTKDSYSGLLDKLSQLLKQGEKAGDFRPAVDAAELYVSISALAYHYLSNRYTLAYLLDRKLSTADDKKIVASPISRISSSAISARAHGGRSRRYAPGHPGAAMSDNDGGPPVLDAAKDAHGRQA